MEYCVRETRYYNADGLCAVSYIVMYLENIESCVRINVYDEW